MVTKKSCFADPAVFFMLLLTIFYGQAANALQLGDISLADRVTLAGSETELQLNGAGYRNKFVFRIYVGALYTETRVNSRDAVQALNGPKRVAMHILYDELPRKKMLAAWREGFADNNSAEQLAKLSARLDTFSGYFPDLKAGDVILLDYLPLSGTTVSINGESRGIIEGEDFYRALLDVWLGDEPADDNLKDAMLAIPE